MNRESFRARAWDRISSITHSLTQEEYAGLKTIIHKANLDGDEALTLAISLCHDRIRLSPGLIHEARTMFRRNHMLRSRIVEKLDHSFKEDQELHWLVTLGECNLNQFSKRYLGEAVFKGEWADELGGKTEQRLKSGVADIITKTNVYEVKDISQWKQGLGQAIIYANELELKPGLALFGPELEARDMETLRQNASEMDVDLLLKVWKQEKRQYIKPSERSRTRESSPVLDFLKRIEELELGKKEIGDEMDRTVRAFGLSGAGSRAIGCLRLEDVYNVKNSRRYGPYGPYYYVYFHRTGKLEKRYLGKRADKFNVRRGAVAKLRQLEVEYKRILKLERQLVRDTVR